MTDNESRSQSEPLGQLGQFSRSLPKKKKFVYKNARARRLSGNRAQLSPTVPDQCELEFESGHWWDVHHDAFPLGIGRRLGRVRATTRVAAELIARDRFGPDIAVTLACGDPVHRNRDSIGRNRRRR